MENIRLPIYIPAILVICSNSIPFLIFPHPECKENGSNKLVVRNLLKFSPVGTQLTKLTLNRRVTVSVKIAYYSSN